MGNSAQREPRRRHSDDVIHIAGRTSPDEGAANDAVDVAQLWSAVRQHGRFVLGVAALLFCAVMAHTMFTRMTFKSSGRLYLGELEMRARAAAGNAANVDISGSAQGDLGSEIEILKSQSLVTQAILDSGRNVTVTPLGWHPPRFWQWMLGGRKPQALDIPARELSVVETALLDDSSGARSYDLHFLTPNEFEVTGESASGVVAVLGRGRLNKPLLIDGLRSMHVRPGTERGPVADARYHIVVQPLDAVTDATLSALTVSAPKALSTGGDGAKVLTLEFTDTSPLAAATFLRVLMSGYLGERQAWKTEDASAAETFVTEQLRTLRDSLDATQKRLADFRSNTGVVVHENEGSAIVEQVGKYEEQRVQARLQVAALQDIRRVLKQPNPPSEAYLFGEANDSVLEELSTKLASSRRLLSDVTQQFGQDAPQAQQARLQVEAQLTTIRGYVNSRLARAQENLNELNRVFSQFEERLKSVPGAEFSLAQLGRESEVYSRVYSYMLERQQQAAILKASTVSKNRILDHPQVPYREDAPKLGLRLASGPVALLFGALLVILHRLFASSLQSESEVRRTVGGLPIFATVPARSQRREAGGRMVDPFSEPLSPAFAEAFRTLRVNLYQEVQSDQGRVLLLTSPTPGDGKTTTVFALACILAADGRKVLVVDADLRKPSHHNLTDKARTVGLREILAGKARWEEAVSTIELSVGRFDSIGAGKLGPAELLSGEQMSRLLNALRIRYDYILLDCASFPVVADPLVLSTVSDCVISVLRLRHTPQKLAGEHVRRLSTAALHYGIVVNDTDLVGSVYPAYPEQPLARRLRDQLATLAALASQGGLARFLNKRLVVGLLIAGVAGAAALVSRYHGASAPARAYGPSPLPSTAQPPASTDSEPMAAPAVAGSADHEPAPAAAAPNAVAPAMAAPGTAVPAGADGLRQGSADVPAQQPPGLTGAEPGLGASAIAAEKKAPQAARPTGPRPRALTPQSQPRRRAPLTDDTLLPTNPY